MSRNVVRIQQVHGDDVNLEYFTVRAYEDCVPVIVCDLCGDRLCDIEPQDVMLVLVDVCRGHIVSGNCKGDRQ
jgi:hypothetical protein